MNLDDDIKIAIMFSAVSTLEDFPVFFSVKPMIGRVSDDGKIFTDIMTGLKTINVSCILGLEGEECFSLLVDANKLLENANETKIEDAIRKLWSRVDRKSFVYASFNSDHSDPMMVPLADSEYQRLFGYSLESETTDIETFNSVIVEYAKGNISDDDYAYFLENLELPPKKGKCKIIEVDFRNN